MRKGHLIRCFMNGIISSMISIRLARCHSHSILKIVLKTKLSLRSKNTLKIIQIYKGKSIMLLNGRSIFECMQENHTPREH
jgi:hypothetical protein